MPQLPAGAFAVPDRTWNYQRALRALNIRRVAFDWWDEIGETGGYAVGRCVAVSPRACEPVVTLLHEIAHVLLGDTDGNEPDDDDPDDTHNALCLRECLAEGVAWLCGRALGLACERSYDYIHESGYILQVDKPFTPAIARRIELTAQMILNAGRV